MPDPIGRSVRTISIIAATEIRALVRSTAFVVSLLLMPVLLAGSLLVQHVTSAAAVYEARRVVVVDGTGRLGDALVRAGARPADDTEGPATTPHYRVELARGDADRLALARRVQSGELLAYVEIPEALLSDPSAVVGVAAERTDLELGAWLGRALSAEARRLRLVDAGVSTEELARIDRPITLEQRALHEVRDGLVVRGATRREDLLGLLAPIALSLLLFSSVMMVAPQLMTAVVEEKLSRVSEVLLGCASPFEIMMGKMCAGTTAALVSGTVYLVGLAELGRALGVAVESPLTVVVAFYVFQILTVMTFGSIFLAVGAAVSELRDGQTLMTPVVLLATTPLLTMTALLREPHGKLAVLLSLFPPTAPVVLMFRVATPPGPRLSELATGCVTTGAVAMVSVWGAGRVFRAGLLRGGSRPRIAELWGWLRGRG